MIWVVLSAVATLIVASYLASLNLAIVRTRRAALEQRFEQLGQQEAGHWLIAHREAVNFTVGLFRTVARLAFFMFVLVALIGGIGENFALFFSDLLIAGLISAPALWICSTVIASAIARHAGTGLITRSTWLLRAFFVIGYPIVKPLWFIDEAVRRLAGAQPREEEAELELLRSIEDTQREGALQPEAAAMLENIVEFSNTDVAEIMTPRTDIAGIALTNNLQSIRQFIAEAGHSRIPVFEHNLDHIVGILYAKDLLRFLGEDPASFKLKPLLRKPIIVPETKPVHELLADFQRSEVHMAIVVDEYGGTAGLVTIEDALEEIVGEIHDEHEPDHEEDPQLTRQDELHAEVDGRYYIDDLNEELGLDLPEEEDYDTIAGYVLSTFGRVPAKDETFETPLARFTVLDVTATTVRKVGIELLTAVSTPIRPNGNGGDESTYGK